MSRPVQAHEVSALLHVLLLLERRNIVCSQYERRFDSATGEGIARITVDAADISKVADMFRAKIETHHENGTIYMRATLIVSGSRVGVSSELHLPSKNIPF